MIENVFIKPLRILSDEKGEVMHMLRCDDPFFKEFGEVYFSIVYSGVIKGWKKHLKQTQYFAVPCGQIKLVLYDDRKNSPTFKEIQELEVGVKNYQLIRIPPQIWYAFQAISNNNAMIANCTDMPHDPQESVKRKLSDESIPYSWETIE